MRIKAKAIIGGAAAAASLALAACGGGSDDSASSEPLSAAQVTQCLQDAGQKVREVKVSLVKIPPDLGVSSQAGGANVWITDDTQAVVDQEHELAEFDKASALTVDDRIVEGNGAVAVVDDTSSPDYKATIEGCI